MQHNCTHTTDLQAEARAIQRRLVRHLEDGGSSDLAPATMDIDPRVYTDTTRFDAETEKVFRQVPMLAGLSGDLPGPGDRLLFDATGLPVVVVRAEDGNVHAFLNMCTHRGGRLVSDSSTSEGLTCPFHGWSFDLNGDLRGMPLADAFENLDRDTKKLVPVPAAERYGMIFVRARPGGAPIDVDAFLGDFAPVARMLDLGSLQCVSRSTLDTRTNWKFALDTFCEVYHVPCVHRDTLSRNLYPNVAVFDHYGLHHRYAGAGRDMAACIGKPESEWPTIGYQAVHYIFPNTTFAFTHSLDRKTPVVGMSQIFPGASVDQTRTLFSTYRRSDSAAVSDEQVAAMHEEFIHIVSAEDYRIAEAAWQNYLNVPPGTCWTFGRAESLLQHYHRDIDNVLAGAVV